jgi:hypothetical protein
VCYLLAALDLAGLGLDRLDGRRHSLLDPALKRHGVRSRRDVLQSGVHHRLREHCRRGRSVAGDVVGLGGDFLD